MLAWCNAGYTPLVGSTTGGPGLGRGGVGGFKILGNVWEFVMTAIKERETPQRILTTYCGRSAALDQHRGYKGPSFTGATRSL